ncbi:acetate uptake transporter family protein [Paenibacillus prosopidis]|uniref:GPR1/FUN34/yaaH family protein n=1 Tax=Paenibacillus prosopidis TaxID=630520 RepID=A0A368W5T1_9BACL|nr:hypothetical protein [Paenibacillus prosopidis]RCW48357.1 hypothetical protein DFP97_10657 [Paenibacillus prosopidis]
MDENKTQNDHSQHWSNPTPAGLVALAVACFCFFALLTGSVDASAMPLLACFLLGGFVIQFVVALLDLKANNLSGGNTYLYFSAFFMLVSGLEMLLKYYEPGLDARIDGWAWTALALVVLLWTPAFFKSPAILFELIVVLNFAIISIAIHDFGIVSAGFSNVLAHIAAYALLICGLLGIYLSAALVVNGTFGKEIFPNPSPFYTKLQNRKKN